MRTRPRAILEFDETLRDADDGADETVGPLDDEVALGRHLRNRLPSGTAPVPSERVSRVPVGHA